MKNKVAAALSAKPTKPPFAKLWFAKLWFVNPWPVNPCLATTWSAAWPWAARIRNPVLLLLKTASRTRQSAIRDPQSDDARPGYSAFSISCGLRATQCGYQTLNQPGVDSLAACAPEECVRTLESCATHTAGESSVHSGRVAVTKSEAHFFQRIHVAGSELLLADRSCGSGTPRKTGSKRTGQARAWSTSHGSGCSGPCYDASLQVKVSAEFAREQGTGLLAVRTATPPHL